MLCFSIVSDWKSRKFFGKIRIAFEEFIDSDNPSNYPRNMVNESWGNTIVHRYLQDIWFHTQQKVGANTTCLWSPQRNCYNYNDALQKHESNGSLTWGRYRLLWHFCWSFVKRYISTLFVYTLSRLCTLNINRSNKKNLFHIKKNKRQMISCRNYERHWWSSVSWKYTSPNRIPSQ